MSKEKAMEVIIIKTQSDSSKQFGDSSKQLANSDELQTPFHLSCSQYPEDDHFLYIS